MEKLPKVSQRLDKFNNLMKEMTHLTEWNMSNIFDLYTLYANIICLDSMEWEVPDWTRNYLPALWNSTLESFDIGNYNDVLQRLNGGKILPNS